MGTKGLKNAGIGAGLLDIFGLSSQENRQGPAVQDLPAMGPVRTLYSAYSSALGQLTVPAAMALLDVAAQCDLRVQRAQFTSPVSAGLMDLGQRCPAATPSAARAA